MNASPAGTVFLVCAIALSHGGATQLNAATPKDRAETRARVLDPAAVETLTPGEARRLTASAGEVLCLPRLNSVSIAAARELAMYRNETGTCTHVVLVPVREEKSCTYTVMVPCPEEITKEDGSTVTIVKCRREHRTRAYTVIKWVPETRSHVCPLTLELNGLSSVKPEVLTVLARHDGNLHLNGLKSLTAGAAKALAEHRGGVLALDGLSSLEPGIAEQLATHQGGLSLNGISSLTLDKAKALCAHEGELFLNGLTELTDSLAAVIAAHLGPTSLLGLQEAAPEAIATLKNQSVALPPKFLEVDTNANR